MLNSNVSTSLFFISQSVNSNSYTTYSNYTDQVNVTNISPSIYPSIDQFHYALHYLPLYISPLMLDSYLKGFCDRFGIIKIYRTDYNGEEWHMNMTEPNNDTRFDIA